MKNDIESGFMSESTSKAFHAKLDSLKHQSDWAGQIKMLKRYAGKYHNEYYVYQQLASTLYIESIAQYQEAVQYAERAMSMEPDDDLNIYTYACALYYVGQLDDAYKYFSKIIAKDVNEIAYGEHGEGIRYAKGLINDSVFMMGSICQDQHKYDEAKDYFTRHLENRKPFQYSDFTKKQVMSHLSEVANA